MATSNPLKVYKAKRNFAVTSEPAEGGKANESERSFVVQKHWATRLHYDFRLELDGTMKSWAVPKGPSLDPRDKRMAVHVEDHPISYNTFEGEIPAQQYGAGKVIIWDKGIWVPVGDPHQGYRNGNLKFELHGHKLQGKWALIRMKGKGGKQEPWLLIKKKDDIARPAEKFSVVDALPDSVTKMESPETHKPLPKISPSRKREAKSTMPATAIKASLPVTLKPQLATLVDRAPDDTDAWQYEIKFDGYRILARIDGQEIRLFTRNGNDWSHKLPALIASMQKLNLAPGWLDGEIVVLNARVFQTFRHCKAHSMKHVPRISFTTFSMYRFMMVSICARYRWSSASNCSARFWTTRLRLRYVSALRLRRHRVMCWIRHVAWVWKA